MAFWDVIIRLALCGGERREGQARGDRKLVAVETVDTASSADLANLLAFASSVRSVSPRILVIRHRLHLAIIELLGQVNVQIDFRIEGLNTLLRRSRLIPGLALPLWQILPWLGVGWQQEGSRAVIAHELWRIQEIRDRPGFERMSFEPKHRLLAYTSPKSGASESTFALAHLHGGILR